MITRPHRTMITVSVLLLLGVAATGCGASDEADGAAESASPDAVVTELRDLLPAEITDDNTLKIATSIYPPVNFYESDGSTLTGFDTELLEEIAARLGVKVAWNVIDFAAIIPGIQSGQYDLASDLNDTVEREEVVDFVTEFRDGTSVLVEKGNPEGLSDLASLCGQTVVVTKGSTQVDLVNNQNENCDEPIELLTMPDDPDAMLTMRNGRATAYLVNTLAGSYSVENGVDGFEVLEGVYDEVYAGLAFPKGSDELRDAMQAAMQSVIDDGAYAKIMQSYGLTNNQIEESVVNAAGS